jgi:hypothetical protein
MLLINRWKSWIWYKNNNQTLIWYQVQAKGINYYIDGRFGTIGSNRWKNYDDSNLKKPNLTNT